MVTAKCTKCGEDKDLRHFPVIGSDDPRWVHGGFQFEEQCNECRDPVDVDIYTMTHTAMRAEIKKLRAGIRQHRDATGHNLCWYVPELWALLPEKVTPAPQVPPLEEFIQCCAAYRASLDKG